MKRLYLMITITNRVMGSKRFVDFYRAFGAPVVFTALGRGTASDEVLSYLGLEATEKSVMLSVVTPACKEVLMKELVTTMHLTNPGTGIAMCLPLSSIGGRTAMNYLITGNPEAEPDVEVKEDESMKDAAYQLIVAIANQGYTDTVMGAARSAGAHGGTILHAKSTGAEDAGKFFGMSIAEEREIILMVVPTGDKNTVMQAIMAQAGGAYRGTGCDLLGGAGGCGGTVPHQHRRIKGGGGNPDKRRRDVPPAGVPQQKNWMLQRESCREESPGSFSLVKSGGRGYTKGDIPYREKERCIWQFWSIWSRDGYFTFLSR